LQEARQNLGDVGISVFNSKMDNLGKRLAAPIANQLPERIYWIPAGPLLGFPLDALRLNGHYLLEKHTVINLLSFPGNVDARTGLRVKKPASVFLAGHPQDYTGDIAIRLDTSPEIQAVTDIFVGPGLHIVQGTALLPDEFQHEHFLNANFIHMSMPGKIDLKYAEQSNLELSENQIDPGRMYLKPIDIRSQQLTADLVFLSATRTVNHPASGFSSQPGLVSDFIDSGAGSVIARLWISGGGINDSFISDFYRQIEGSGDVADALRAARLNDLTRHRGDGLFDWAGYQLFIN
jgi:CHAT domain-containing protein